MSKHLIVMSVDAMVFEDLATLRTLPNFKRLIENGSRVDKVRTIYPTLTHPIHVAIKMCIRDSIQPLSLLRRQLPL